MMDDELAEYDPRYLAGIVLFNRGDFFEAHEVWEELWIDMAGPEKQFFQGLIQAAVALCHFCNGNLAGARKVYLSSRDYMQKYTPELHGLDIEQFWQDMHTCFEQVLEAEDLNQSIPIVEDLIPEIHVTPPPESWPEPEDYLPDDSH